MNSNKIIVEAFCSNYNLWFSDYVDIEFEESQLIIKIQNKNKNKSSVLLSVRKTNKFNTALLYGVPIVNYDWVQEWMKDPEQELLSIKRYVLREGWDTNPHTKLFKNTHFIIPQSWNNDPSLQNINLKDRLLEMGGIIHRTHFSAISYFDNIEEKPLIYELLNKAPRKIKVPKSLKSPLNIKPVHYKWVIDWVIEWKFIEPKDFKFYT